MNNLNQREVFEKDTVTNVPKNPSDPAGKSMINCKSAESLPKTELAQIHPAPDEPVWLIAGKDAVNNVPNGEILPSTMASTNSTEAQKIAKTNVTESHINPSESGKYNSEDVERDITRHVPNTIVELPVTAVHMLVKNKLDKLAEVVLEHTERQSHINVSSDEIEHSAIAEPTRPPISSQQPSSSGPSCVQVVLEQPPSVMSNCVDTISYSQETLENTRQTVL